MMDQNELLSLKSDIESAKQEVSKLSGKHDYLMNQLKDQFGCDTIADAEKKSKVLETKINKLEDKIETATTELEEKYELAKEN